MVKASSVLLADVADDKITEALDLGALARIRLYLMTATDGNGNHLFFDFLGDLTDAAKADEAETLIDLLIEEPTVKNAIRKIAANFASAYLITALGGSFIAGELSLSKILDKQGVTELEKLTVSPLMRSALSSATAKLTTGGAKVPAVLYLALGEDATTKDLDDNTVDCFEGAALPYLGAPEAGILGVIVNGVVVEVDVEEGDTPIEALNRLFIAFESLPTQTRPNISLALNEKANWSGSRRLTFNDPLSGLPVTESFTTISQGAYITVLPREYEPAFDLVVVTIYAKSRDPDDTDEFIAGIPGFIYGVSSALIELTYKGPHAIAADLAQGKVTALQSTSSDSATDSPISDSFFFRVEDNATEAAGELVYQVNEHVARTVDIPEGSSAIDVITLLAADLATAAATQRVLGAVRPSNAMTIQGTPETGPSIAMVSFGLEAATTNIIITIQSVPAGVTFGVVAANSLTLTLFDAAAKSVIITTTINRPIVHGVATSDPGQSNTGTVFKVTHTQSTGLKKVLDGFGGWSR